jgi:hypothetical protein
VVGYGPFFLRVIHEEGLCASSEDINMLMMCMNRGENPFAATRVGDADDPEALRELRVVRTPRGGLSGAARAAPRPARAGAEGPCAAAHGASAVAAARHEVTDLDQRFILPKNPVKELTEPIPETRLANYILTCIREIQNVLLDWFFLCKLFILEFYKVINFNNSTSPFFPWMS